MIMSEWPAEHSLLSLLFLEVFFPAWDSTIRPLRFEEFLIAVWVSQKIEKLPGLAGYV